MIGRPVGKEPRAGIDTELFAAAPKSPNEQVVFPDRQGPQQGHRPTHARFTGFIRHLIYNRLLHHSGHSVLTAASSGIHPAQSTTRMLKGQCRGEILFQFPGAKNPTSRSLFLPRRQRTSRRVSVPCGQRTLEKFELASPREWYQHMRNMQQESDLRDFWRFPADEPQLVPKHGRSVWIKNVSIPLARTPPDQVEAVLKFLLQGVTATPDKMNPQTLKRVLQSPAWLVK